VDTFLLSTTSRKCSLANPKALHHFSRLEDNVAEAKRLVEVAKDRAPADLRIAAEKAAIEVLG
jgi:hypothetical protein